MGNFLDSYEIEVYAGFGHRIADVRGFTFRQSMPNQQLAHPCQAAQPGCRHQVHIAAQSEGPSRRMEGYSKSSWHEISDSYPMNVTGEPP